MVDISLIRGYFESTRVVGMVALEEGSISVMCSTVVYAYQTVRCIVCESLGDQSILEE